MIDLQSFVSQALGEILQGVKAAQEAARNTGAVINPSNVKPGGRAQTQDGRGVEDVHFDIALTAEEKTGGKGGLRVVGVSIGGEHAVAESCISRVRFSIPVCWPLGDTDVPPK
jgi:hypothetical protein